VNVTLPHKEAAALLAETPTARVKRTGAANTLWWDQEGRLHADNTDGRGLCRDLGHWGIDLRGARILILGAGGAAMGVMPDLLEAEPAVVQVWNRTAERAAALCARFEGGGTKIQTLDDGASVPQPFDLVINATSAGVQGSAPPVPANALGKATACYDMFYGTRPTAFMDACRRAGASRCRDGLGMLVEQAAVGQADEEGGGLFKTGGQVGDEGGEEAGGEAGGRPGGRGGAPGGWGGGCPLLKKGLALV
jgi:shikimate dehydrogenase